MEATRIGVTEAGWLDDSPNGLTTVDTVPLQPQVIQKGSIWKATVEEEKQKILADRSKNIPSKPSKTMSDPNENDVKIIDHSYLQRDFKAKIAADNKLIDDTVQEFFLNTEQERAFRIIANHAVEPKSGQLKMYLGGMGGTGKSQVIKALMHFFKQRNESHRIVVLGPTGSSAALINGSTYHSFLGINPGENSANKIAQLKARLEGVVYIFIDEVSMLSCNDLYRISAQLAKALNAFDLPFGGINIVFATENFPGKLSLCLGMPVMIRNNDATKLCITKGQEGFVVGWQAEKGPHGKRVLDTLFVKLDKPAKTIQIPGLPENVVSLVKGAKTIKCIFPSDLKKDIERQQVHVLPNFAMTDYASQGKNRPKNVAHLSSCFTHMEYIALPLNSTSNPEEFLRNFQVNYKDLSVNLATFTYIFLLNSLGTLNAL